MSKLKKLVGKIDINIIIILVFSLIVMYPFFISPYIWGHDTYYHYANIFATLQTIDISNFNFFPDKVIPIIAKDFGWGNGIFYPSLPHYLTTYLYIFGSLFGVTSIFTSLKVIHIIVTFLAGIFMYVLGRKLFKNKLAALVSSILYITFPYYFIDSIVRDAFSECFMFMFLPLVFLGLEYLFENNYKKFYIFFIIGYVGSIYSHLISAVYLTIFVIIFLLFNLKKVLNKQTIKTLFISALITLGLCSPFLFSLIEHTIFGSYAVYLDGAMYSTETMRKSVVSLSDYFTTNRPSALDVVTITPISIAALISFIGVVVYLIVKCKNNDAPVTLKYYIILAILAIFMMLPIITWEYLPSFLKSIQFVWRINLFLAFFMSLSAAYVIICFRQKVVKCIIFIIIVILSILMLWTLKPMVVLETYDTSTFDIDNYGISSRQYLPAKTYKHPEYWTTRSDEIIIKKGEAKIKVIENNTPYLKFKVQTKNAILELPRLYYLGYDIRLNDKKINYYENNYGFIEIKAKDSGTVTVSYVGTVGDKISIVVFSITLIISISYLVYKHRQEKKDKVKQDEKR